MDVHPLKGIRVFEFGSNVAGPYATWILAELGADVIKVERPEGDDARTWGPPFWKGASTVFHSINRNKDSIVIDLKDPEAAQALRERIVEEADVVLQNMRPGVADELGFGAETFVKENPRIIYCNLWAYGAKGPLKYHPGYDALLQGFGGIMSVTGDEGGTPVRAGISVADKGTGMWCAIGILAALLGRQSSGEGGVIDASLFETVLGWMVFHNTAYQASGEVPIRRGSAARGIVPYQAYECADGYLIIAASNDRLFERFAKALDRPDWLEDERFESNPKRVEHRDIFNPMLEELLRTEPRAVWQEKLDAVKVPNAPIQTADEVLAHAQTKALGMAQETDDPNMQLFGLPLSFDGKRPPYLKPAPRLDGQSDK